MTEQMPESQSDGNQESSAEERIKRIARRLLENQLDDLTDHAVRLLQADEPEYAQSRVSQSDLKRSMRRTLALALVRITGDEIPDDILTAAAEVGRLRAEQGLPLPALLHSYRLDLRVLWEALIREGRSEGVAGEQGFLESSILVWEAVEANTTEVVDAYRRAMEDQSRNLEVLRGRAFEKLVLTADTDPSAVKNAAKRLLLPEESRILMLVGDDVPVDHSVVVSSVARLKARGLQSYFGWVGDDFMGIVLLAGRRPEDVVTVLDGLARWKVGAAVVDGLRHVPRGVRLARAVIRSRHEPGVQLLHFDWPAVLIGANDELAKALADQVLGPLLALPDNDRAAVFETLQAYVQGSGSVSEIASTTLRHRNTVRNRLQTVERITGLSLSRPQDIAAVVLAMSWFRGADSQRSTQ
ncbi:MAG: helix-turn-helix domain-containing protein [Nocardioides sp.]|nr:helix-turn-helix domain-containing protein [Nocardioides sp.]